MAHERPGGIGSTGGRVGVRHRAGHQFRAMQGRDAVEVVPLGAMPHASALGPGADPTTPVGPGIARRRRAPKLDRRRQPCSAAPRRAAQRPARPRSEQWAPRAISARPSYDPREMPVHTGYI